MMNNVFFFSEKCNYSKDAYTLIKKVGLQKFLFKDVDKIDDLPDIIDRVPCILTKEMKVYVDDELFVYLNNMLNIEPFMIKEMKGLSDTYSYMDNSGINLNHMFQFLDKDNKIITPSESDNNKIINYDSFIAERDNDLKIINNNDV